MLLYAYPAIFNMPIFLRQRLERIIEKRIFRIISCDTKFPALVSVGDQMCEKFFSKVLSDDQHPFFCDNDYRVIRNFCPLRRPITKTRRCANIFLMFFK